MWGGGVDDESVSDVISPTMCRGVRWLSTWGGGALRGMAARRQGGVQELGPRAMLMRAGGRGSRWAWGLADVGVGIFTIGNVDFHEVDGSCPDLQFPDVGILHCAVPAMLFLILYHKVSRNFYYCTVSFLHTVRQLKMIVPLQYSCRRVNAEGKIAFYQFLLLSAR